MKLGNTELKLQMSARHSARAAKALAERQPFYLNRARGMVQQARRELDLAEAQIDRSQEALAIVRAGYTTDLEAALATVIARDVAAAREGLV